MTWQPIETAPTDERIILWCANVLREGPREEPRPKGAVFGMVTTYPGLPNQARGDSMNGDWKFTHWMPLPEPPNV